MQTLKSFSSLTSFDAVGTDISKIVIGKDA